MKQERYRSGNRQREKRSRSRSNHRERNKSSHHRSDRSHSYNRPNQHHRKGNSKFKPNANLVKVQPPKAFLLSAPHECSGSLLVNLVKGQSHPSRCQTSRLADLKNKITPIESLWGTHIKQYLNISEFVEIHRYHKSLAEPPIQYGKSIINYQQDSTMNYSITEQSHIFSRAYFKLWEILETGVLKPYFNHPMSIGCVAEGPGGFIHALIDYRVRQHRSQLSTPRDSYNAITLKIDSSTRNAKDWSDPRGKQLFKEMKAMGHSINLSYGQTGTGDLLKRENIQFFSSQVQKKCQLVTGDGGIECIGDKQFEYQQIFNCKLFFGEIITALHIQEVKGKFILKIYDCGFDLTRQLIVLLALYYQSVQIIKPITSRPGNSEKYLLCEDFKGITNEELNTLKAALAEWTEVEPKLSYFENKEFVQSMFDFSALSNYQTIYNRIKEANEWFVEEQIQKIEEGLALAERHDFRSQSIQHELNTKRFEEQIDFAYSWCKLYGLPTIEVSEGREEASEGRGEKQQ